MLAVMQATGKDNPGALSALPVFKPAVAAEPAVPRTYGDAMRWYRKAADNGDPKAQFYWGLILEQGIQGRADVAAAFQWFRKSAQQGYALAQLKTAQALHFGSGADVDVPQALFWYEKAAGAGVAEAQFNLAILLETEEGRLGDPNRARKLYGQAAAFGIAAAAVNLANMHIQGTVDGADLIQGYVWLTIAERLGDKSALSLRQQMAPQLSAKDQEQAKKRAAHWLRDHR